MLLYTIATKENCSTTMLDYLNMFPFTCIGRSGLMLVRLNGNLHLLRNSRTLHSRGSAMNWILKRCGSGHSLLGLSVLYFSLTLLIKKCIREWH